MYKIFIINTMGFTTFVKYSIDTEKLIFIIHVGTFIVLTCLLVWFELYELIKKVYDR
jgi:hypothetical protein